MEDHVVVFSAPLCNRSASAGHSSLLRQTGEKARLMDRGDRFNELYQAQYETVLRYALRRTDPETARDAVAETFLVAWRRLDTVPADQAQATPWLYSIARNVLANAADPGDGRSG